MFGLQKEVQKIIHQKGIARELEAHLVCRHGREIITRICFAQPHQLRALKYLKSTLTLEIGLNNIVIGQKIRTNQKRVVAAINKQMKGEYVTKIRYRIL